MEDSEYQTKYVSCVPVGCIDPKPEDIVIVAARWVHENVNHWSILYAASKRQLIPIDGGLLERLPLDSGIGIFGDSHLIQAEVAQGRAAFGLNLESSRQLTIAAVDRMVRGFGRDVSVQQSTSLLRRHPGW